MSPRLVFSGEVQVDIRFLVAFEAEEDFEGDVMAFFDEFFATLRAFFIRKVDAHTDAAILDKFAVLALGTNIMGWQGVNLCNIAHGGGKRGSYRPSGSYQVAILDGLGD